MRLITAAATKGTYEIAAQCAREVLVKLAPAVTFDEVRIEFGETTFATLEDRTARLCIAAQLVEEHGETYLTTLIAKKLLLLQRKLRGDEMLPSPIEDLLAYRALLRYGFADALSSYFYTRLLTTPHKTMGDFLAANLSWLTYAQTDQFYASLFYESVKKMPFPQAYWTRCSSLFTLLKRDLLFSDTLQRATRLYTKVTA